FDERISSPHPSDTVRESADQIWSINVATAVHSPACCSQSQWLAGVPGEDSREVPAFNDPVNPARSVGNQQAVGSEWQFTCAMRFEPLCAVEREKALLQVPVPWIAFAGCCVTQIGVARGGVANGSRPGVVQFSADASGQALSYRRL